MDAFCAMIAETAIIIRRLPMFPLNAPRILNVRTALAIAAALGVSACGGGGSSSQIPSPAANAAGGSASSTQRFPVTLKVAIPATQAASGQRRPRFVSPSTQSLTYSISTTATPPTVAASGTVSLTLGTSGCVSSLASTICTLTTTFNLAPGSYTGTFETFDGANGTGNPLSQNQTVPITVTASTTNLVNISLGGIVSSVSVAPSPTQSLVVATAPITNPSQTLGKASLANYALVGAGLPGAHPVQFTIAALDADGNTIVGSGAPTFAVTPNGVVTFTATQPGAGANGPNTFTLTPSSVSLAQNIVQVTATPASGTGACASGACSSGLGITTPGIVAQEGAGGITFYADGTLTPFATVQAARESSPTLPDSLTGELAFDPQGNLFFATGQDNIQEISPPYTVATVPFAVSAASKALNFAQAQTGQEMVIDTAGNVWINCFADTVVEFVKAQSFAATTYTLSANGQANNNRIQSIAVNKTSLAAPWVITTDGSLNDGGLFQLTSTTPTAIVGANVQDPAGVALDAAGNVYVSLNGGLGGVSEFSSTGAFVTNTGAATVTDPTAGGLAVDQTNGTIAVANQDISFAALFGPGLTTPTSGLIRACYNVAFDHLSNVLIQCAGLGLVEYAPPYTGAPIASLPSLGFNPQMIATFP